MKSTLLIISACLLGGCSSMMTTEQQEGSDSGWLANVLDTVTFKDEDDNELVNEQVSPPFALSSADTSVNFHNQMQGMLLNKQQAYIQQEQYIPGW